jgi:glycosyltransferase involved in cell wall biosynthesis
MSDAGDATGPAPDIVVVTHFYPSHGGGIELVAARLVDEYLKAGHTVEWFASATDPPPPARPGLQLRPVPATNVVERLTQLPYPIWTPSVVPALWRSIGRARAVHVHEHLYVGSLLALLIGRIRGKRVVLTQHMGALRLPNRLATTLYPLGAKTLAWPAMRLASHVAFVSTNVSRFFFGADAPGPRGSLVFNGLDNDTFAFADEHRRRASRARLGLGEDEPVAIFAGRFVRKKGLPFLRDLAARTHDVKWLFAGWGPDDPGLWRLGNVVCLGRLSQPDLALALAAADVLVLPSSGEGFPLVVQEALACGTAVLSTSEVRNACPAASDAIESAAYGGDDADLPRWDTALRASLTCGADATARLERAARAAALWSWHTCAMQYLARLDLRQHAGTVIDRSGD